MEIPVESVIEKLAHKKFFLAILYDMLVAFYVDASGLQKLVAMGVVTLLAIAGQIHLDKNGHTAEE